MQFTPQTWRDEIQQQWRRMGGRLQTVQQHYTPHLVYGTLCGMTVWPLVEATQKGEAVPALVALGSVAGSVGANLLGEQVQRWKDGADRSEVDSWLAEHAAKDAVLRAALDDLLDRLDAIPRTAVGLSGDDWAWFERTLRQELAQLGSLPRFERIFDQRWQQVEHQVNVAGDYIDQRQFPRAPRPNPQALRRAYLNRLAQETRRLPLTGVDPKAAVEDASRELQLSAVYTALLTRRPASTEEGGRPDQRSAACPTDQDLRRLSALEVLNREAHLVLLGDPGSGKSTFVNFVAACLAGEVLGFPDANLAVLTAPLAAEEGTSEEQRPQPWDHGALLPVRVLLRDLVARGLPPPGDPVSDDALWQFIVAELGEMLKGFIPHLESELQERGGLILLDGLDEVPDANQRREQVKRTVQAFAGCFPRCRFLVTSRTYAYQRQDWKLDGFDEAVLSPFTPAQVARFVDGWYAHIGPRRGLTQADAKGRAALLKTAIERSARLSELAGRPLLLTLMASLHAWRGGSLPENREQLYADAVDLLLDQWESIKLMRDSSGQVLEPQPGLAEWLKVDRAVVRAQLNRVAFEAHRDQPQLVDTADIAEERLVGALMAVTDNPDVRYERLVEYLRDRAGLLAARGEGVYTFPHRTFQEYLAACHLTDHGFPDDLAGLLRGDPGRWREVTLLAGAKAARGTSSAVWELAEALCHRDPPPAGPAPEADCWSALLAAQTLLENERARLRQVAERNAPKLERVRLWQRAIVEREWLPWLEQVMAGSALAILGDDRDLGEMVTVPAGPFLMGSDDGDQDERPRQEVTLPAFRIGKYLVTNAQYRRFVEATGRGWDSDSAHWRATFPATDMTWHDAVAYCAWLTHLWRAQGKIAADEAVRLPSEAEWEKAARGTDGRAYPWGDDWTEGPCNTAEFGLNDTTPVGIFPVGASPYGCLDMAGNVWEWTRSLYGQWVKDKITDRFGYPYDAADGREQAAAGNDWLRVVRGGAWLDDQDCARCAFRSRRDPSSGLRVVGFRVVVSPISPASGLPGLSARTG